MTSKPRNKAFKNPLLIDVLSALGDVEILEKYLIDRSAPRRNFLHGEQVDGRIIINPAPSVVSILVHELIHQVRPSWQEVTVRQWTTRLMRSLSHEQIEAIYQQYLDRRLQE